MKLIILVLILVVSGIFVDSLRETQNIKENPHIYQSKGSVFKVRED